MLLKANVAIRMNYRCLISAVFIGIIGQELKDWFFNFLRERQMRTGLFWNGVALNRWIYSLNCW